MSGLLTARPGRRLFANLLRKLGKGPIFLAGYLRRRDPGQWVFGNFKGFRDSPRYLAEYVACSRPDITAWWIARSEREAEAARAAGLHVAMREGRDAARVQRRAGVAFFCNSFQDLNLSLLGGAYIVHLYHGTPLKRISLDVDQGRFTGGSRLLRLLAGVNRSLIARKYGLVGMFVAGGELARSRYVTAFGASPERVRAIGTPRFDIIRGGAAYDRVAGGDLRHGLGYGPDDIIVLWLPTWRERGDAAWLPRLEAADVDAALGGTQIKLLVKTHPFADRAVIEQYLPAHPQVKLLREQDVDVNCLLHIADMLVTDYSSAAFDFAILQRPIHFLAPDVEAYSAGRDLYEPYENLTSGLHHADWRSLLEALREGSQDGDASEGKVLARRVSEYSRNNIQPDTCKRIVEAITQSVVPAAR
jgi:CDP-glycerol glycerophosphotransferase